MSDENKALTRRFIDEAFSNGNLAAVDELVTDDYVDHSPAPDIPADKAGLKQLIEMFRSAFPDLTVTVEDMVAEGDKVAVRVVTRGTHQGELIGLAATGRTVTINDVRGRSGTRLCRVGFGAMVLAAAVACGGGTPAEEPASPVSSALDTGAGTIVRIDPMFDELVPADAVIELLADGFGFTEGPHWIEYHGLYGGAVLFSDIPGNAIQLWSSDRTVTPFLSPVFEGDSDAAMAGSNGITTDADGRVLFTEHGNRRISRIEADGSRVIVVDTHEGNRLNSPNDLIFHSDGSLYFTDPPYGLAQQDEDPAKELDVNGIYRLSPEGTLTLLASQTRPNGIGFSPDESLLYVANSDNASRVWMVYDVVEDGSLDNGRVFADVTDDAAEGVPDGLKVDARGNLWGTGPGGIWVFDPTGRHLGSIQPDERPVNLTFGGPEGTTLFMTAQTGLYRVRVEVGWAGE